MVRIGICWIVLLLLASNTLAGGLTHEKTLEIRNKAAAAFGPNCDVEVIINLDSTKYPRGRFSDPYGTLRGRYFFGCALGRDTAIVGIYKDNDIVWHSDTLVGATEGVDLYGTRDLTNTGKVTLLVPFYLDMRRESAKMWLFQWDGESGSVINALDEEHESVLYGSMDEWRFIDDNGDGILEIHTKDPDADSSIIYSWNGTLYGAWPLSFLVGRTPPRNIATVGVSAGVEIIDTTFCYHYALTNPQSSQQDIDGFLLDRRTSSVIEPVGRLHWKFLSRISFITGWKNDFICPSYIVRGAKDSSFGYRSKGLPGVVSYYARGNNPPGQWPIQDTVDPYGEMKRNSVKGLTVGPVDTLASLDHPRLLDTLLNYINQSRSLGWIGSQEKADQYARLVDSAKSQLERDANRSARHTLDTVLAHSVADSMGALSSEAFALIYFNVQYLLTQLPVPPPEYGMGINVSGSGTVTKSPDLALYDQGTTVQLTAVPATGCRFVGWSGSITDTANPISVVMDTAKSITATFMPNSVIITATADTNGTISLSGEVSVTYGGNQSFTFTPHTGCHVDSVVVDGVKTDSIVSYTFHNVTAAHTISGHFSINIYTLTVNGANGTIAKNPNQSTYNYGSSVQLTASPNSCYHFTSWSGDTAGTQNPTTITMLSNRTVTAGFAINTYTITPSVEGIGGFFTPSTAQTVTCGGSQWFRARSSSHMVIGGLTVDGIEIEEAAGLTDYLYTFANVTVNHTISVGFVSDQMRPDGD